MNTVAPLTLNMILADAVPSPNMEELLLVPRRGADPHDAIRIVHAASGRRARRTAFGIHLSVDDALALQRHHESGRFHWSNDAIRFLEIRENLARHHSAIVRTIDALRAGSRGLAAQMLTQRRQLQVLDDHQVVNVAAMTLPDSPGLCLFDEQGAGKTVSMIFTFDELVHRNLVDFMLIVAPKSMVSEWPKDFARFTGDLYKVATATGNAAAKRRVIASRPEVLVTNFETAIQLERELAVLLRSHEGRAIVAVDESFFIKSPEARRTAALRRLREHADRAYVLCGTPAPNAPSDLVQQFSFVDFGWTFRGVDLPDDRAQALPVVQAAIEARGLYLRNLKQDVLPDLPAKAFHRVHVPMESIQGALYAQALTALTRSLQDTTDDQFSRNIASFLAQRAALLQICSDPSAVSPSYAEIPAKFHALDEILGRLIDQQGEKVIIWSFYTRTIDRIIERYSRYNPVRYDGKVTSTDERREAVWRFQEDDETLLMIANPAAAGAGLTLHRARVAVYESMSNQAAHYLQSLDRIHRRGQERPVDYYVLICDGTIEEQEYARLLSKEAAAQSLLGDVVAPPRVRTAMLDEMLSLIGQLAAKQKRSD